MLRSVKDLERYTVAGTDGDVGAVVDFLLDDERWIVRYLVVDAGNWLGGRQVLISPISFRRADWNTRRFHLSLTKDKIKKAPNVDADLPVSRQHERDYHRYYGYPYYWGMAGYWGTGSYPGLLSGGWVPKMNVDPSEEGSGDAHLRSVKVLRQYHIQGTDDAIGHVHDFIVDDETWAIRYLVVDTRNWWPGKKVLISPQWASRIEWVEGKVHVGLSRQAIKNSPEWHESEGINREYEARLYDYHGRPVYWPASDHAENRIPPRTSKHRVVRP